MQTKFLIRRKLLEKNSNNCSNPRKHVPGNFRIYSRGSHFPFNISLPTMILLLGILFLAACGSDGQIPTTEPTLLATSAAPVLATVPPKSTAAGLPTSTSYPPPADDIGAPEPPGYPEPPSVPPTLEPYPGGFAVIQHAAGVQCEDPLFPDLDSATAALELAGIKVQEAEEIQLTVCESCSCPTSTHYRILIHPAELDAALELGWQRGY